MQLLVKKATLIGGLLILLGSHLSVQAQTALPPPAIDLGALGAHTSFNTTPITGSFEYLYNFTVGSNTGSVFVVNSFEINGVGTNVDNISLYTGSFDTAASLVNVMPLAVSGVPIIQTGTVTPTIVYTLQTVVGSSDVLSTNTVYTLAIKGTSNNNSPYTGTIVLAAVPEPESYAMLLAGLGMMGFVAKRRRLTVAA